MNYDNKNNFIKALKDKFPSIKHQKCEYKLIKKLNEIFKDQTSLNSSQKLFYDYYSVTQHIINNFNKVNNLNFSLTLDRYYTICNFDNGGYILQQKLNKTKNIMNIKKSTKEENNNSKKRKNDNDNMDIRNDFINNKNDLIDTNLDNMDIKNNNLYIKKKKCINEQYIAENFKYMYRNTSDYSINNKLSLYFESLTI